MIYTDSNGKPYIKPEAPGPDATSEEQTAYIRARNAWVDARTDAANKAFMRGFKKGLKGKETLKELLDGLQ